MEEVVHGINVNYERDKLFTESGLTRLKDGYMTDNETSPQERFAYVCKTFASNDAHAQRLYDYASQLWLSFSTPILSYGKTKRSLPISCYATVLGDSMESILDTSSETRMLAVVGGGVGLHVELRPGDKKSSGIIPHLKTYDVDTLAFKQGTTRRGATAAYLSISHPEIIEFLEMRKPTGGDPNRKCMNLHHGVNISDDFMHRIEQMSVNKDLTKEQYELLDKWELVNPNTGEVTKTVSAKELWERMLTLRMETGEPYFWFIDTVNKNLPEYQKNLGLFNKGSNLCSEISLATNAEEENNPARSFVCCLSSVNAEHYDEWKNNPDFIGDIVEMLDNVITIFVRDAAKYPALDAVVYSAMRERALGIGMLGWHSLLQKRNVPFESAIAVSINKQMWSKMHSQAKTKTWELAEERGACPDFTEGNQDGRVKPVRNSHLFAVAPNASSAIIMGASPSGEMLKANVFLEKGVSGTKVHRNKYLEKALDAIDKNTPEVWSSIVSNDGSVQQLDFMDEYQKDVFKTAAEVNQSWVIQHAADRQEFVCQAQSLNLFFAPNANVEYLHYTHLMAWQQGLKSLYYLRSDTIRKADKVGNAVVRERIEEMKEQVEALSMDEGACLACE